MHGNCVSKSSANPKTKRGFTNHVEGMTSGCNITACMRVLTCGEGPATNLAQYLDYLLECESIGFEAKLLWHQDDACGTLSHMLVELVKLAQGIPSKNPMINKYPFVLLAAVAVDLSVDAFHAWKGHVEEFCVQLLDSRTRNLPPKSNSQSGEQQWQGLVRLTRSLNYMNQGMHEMWKLTHYGLQNKWRMAKTDAELKREPKPKASPTVYWHEGVPMNKHQYRSKLVQEKKASKGLKVKKRKPAKKISHRTNSRRLPMTAALKRLLPLGFDERLLQLNKEGDRRLYTDFSVSWFRENYVDLMVEVKKLLDTPMAPTMEARFTTKAFLHKWLVDKVIWTANCGSNRDEVSTGGN
jgi:hypothetical protein